MKSPLSPLVPRGEREQTDAALPWPMISSLTTLHALHGRLQSVGMMLKLSITARGWRIGMPLALVITWLLLAESYL